MYMNSPVKKNLIPASKIPKKKIGGRQVIVLDHARIDPSHCLADGLFRPMRRGDQKNASMDIHYRYKGFTFWWRNYQLLDISDQSVFLAIHRLAAARGRAERVGPDHQDPTFLNLRQALNMKLDAEELQCLAFSTSLNEIAKLIGLTNTGPNLKAIKDSLLRLSGVSFVIYKGEEHTSTFWQANLISQLAGCDGKVVIAVNPLLGKALVGKPSTYISMEEQRSLKSDPAKRLHVWLSSWASSQEERKIELDSLVPHVWGNQETSGESTNRRRRGLLRKGLAEIAALTGWTIEEDPKTSMIRVKKSEMGYLDESDNTPLLGPADLSVIEDDTEVL